MTSLARIFRSGCGLAGILLITGCTSMPFNGPSHNPYADLLAQGQQEFHDGNLDGASKTFSHAIELAPDRADGWNARAYVDGRRGRMTEAIQDFHEAVRRDSKNGLYHNNLGVAYLESGNPTAALAAFSESVSLSANSPLPLIHRALAYRHLERFEDALADLNAAVTLDGKNATAYANRAVVYALLKNFTAAKDDLARALEIDQTIFQVYESRGFIHMLDGQFKLATLDFSKALALGSHDPLTYYNHAVAFSMIGETINARKNYHISCQRGYSRACPFSPFGKTSTTTLVTGHF